MDDIEFEKIVDEGVQSVPKEFLERLQNVAITIEDEPTVLQLRRLHLHHGFSLFGLYEGVPPTRGTGMIPAKITIFKNPILRSSQSEEDMKDMVKHTVWHEIAHAFGLDEKEVREAEQKRQERKNSHSKY